MRATHMRQASRFCLVSLLLFIAFGASASSARRAVPINAHAALLSPDIVISQVYGAGGNSGATFRNDFIELFIL